MESNINSVRAQIKPVNIPDSQKLKGQIYHLQFAPSNPGLLAYERLILDKQEIYFYNINTSRLQHITALSNTAKETGNIFENLLRQPDIANLSSYEGQLDWRPVLDAQGRQWFVFVSSGDNKGYDLYLSYIGPDGKVANKKPIRLQRRGTDHFPKWSPDGNSLVFVGESEQGMDIYLCSNIYQIIKTNNADKFNPKKITVNKGEDCYPVWSPDGQYIAFQSEGIDQGIKNMGINIIDMHTLTKPAVRLTGTLHDFNEYKPSWSPDGRFIAYYLDHSPINSTAGNQLQDIGVLQIVRSVQSNEITGGKVIQGYSRRLAENVIPKRHSGPVWYAVKGKNQQTARNLIIYVAKDESKFNPIIMKDFSTWRKRERYNQRDITEDLHTKLNRELNLNLWPSATILAYVAQEKDINELKLAKLASHTRQTEKFTVPIEMSQGTAVKKSLLLPGLGQWYKGQRIKGSIFAVLETVALTSAVVFHVQSNKLFNDIDDFKNQYSNAVSQENINEYYKNWESGYKDWESANNTRNILIVAAISIWGLNILDSSLGFPRIMQKPIQFPNNISLSIKPTVYSYTSSINNHAILYNIEISF